MTTTTEVTMTPELFDQWIEALESGEYAKGSGKLRSQEYGITSYCCLGVLCDMTGMDLDAVLDDGDYGIQVGDMAGDMDGSTPEELARLIPDEEVRANIAQKNDNSDSFAPVIELLQERKAEIVQS